MRFTKLLTTASALALGATLMAGTAWADDNSLFMEQVGDNNFAGGSQSGVLNETYVKQNGSFNTAGASTGLAPTSNRNSALILQNGNRNSANWSFLGGPDNSFSRNTLGIVQDTNRNFAGFKMKDTPSIVDTTIFVKQTGGNENYVGNGAPITSGGQNDTVGNSAPNGQTAPLTLAGVNTANIVGSSVYTVPVSGNQTASVHGDDNFFGIVQDGANNAFAVMVNGNNNVIGGGLPTTDLNSESGTSFFNGFAAVGGSLPVTGLASQQGSSNTGVVAQDGNFNAVSFMQTGNNNVGEVYQSGTGNFSVAHQM